MGRLVRDLGLFAVGVSVAVLVSQRVSHDLLPVLGLASLGVAAAVAVLWVNNGKVGH